MRNRRPAPPKMTREEALQIWKDRIEPFIFHREPDECWVPLLCTSSKNYRTLTITYGYRQYYTAYAHRISYLAFVGEIEDENLVLHHCDNPGCSNPKHLWQGGQSDNIQDAVVKGRFTKDNSGEKNPRAKLTEEAIEIIKTSPLYQRELAKLFGVNQTTISAVKSGKTWRKSNGN